MERTLKTKGWTLLDSEGTPVAEGLPTKADAAYAMLMDDGYDYEIRPEEDGGWRLWTLDSSRHSAGRHRMTETVIFSTEDDESKAEAEIFEKAAAMAGEWRAHSGYEILTDAEFAGWRRRVGAELAEFDAA